MGTCSSKPPRLNPYAPREEERETDPPETPDAARRRIRDVLEEAPTFPSFRPGPAGRFLGEESPAGQATPAAEGGVVLAEKRFGYSRQFRRKYEVGEEVVSRGHFGYTCSALVKKGPLKGQAVAVKVLPKVKMTTAIAVEDVKREVKILRAVTGHDNVVQFHDAFEDEDNVYIVTEMCGGGNLLSSILSRGGKYSEDEAKAVLVQILNVVAFIHLQGVVHRNLKPENFLFKCEGSSHLKAIEFGLSDFVRPDEKLGEIVGSVHYAAPEVLRGSYGMEADVWSVGVIAFTLLCGSRPFWARTESGIFREVLKSDPSFEDSPWPALSSEGRDFVERVMEKDPRRRFTAAQALGHPWIRSESGTKIPLDIHTLRLMKAYMRSTPLRKAALLALSKTLTEEDLQHLKQQFSLLRLANSPTINLESIKMSLTKHETDATKEPRVADDLALLKALQYRRMEFGEFCAAALNLHQLEALDSWEQCARRAYKIFDDGNNRTIVIEELATELGLSPSIQVHKVLNAWIRHADGKLSYLGFVKLLHCEK